MKNKKPKSKINKWKLTAIISLVVNGIVALLLTIGLATPKSYVKASADYSYSYDASKIITSLSSIDKDADYYLYYDWNLSSNSTYRSYYFVNCSNCPSFHFRLMIDTPYVDGYGIYSLEFFHTLGDIVYVNAYIRSSNGGSYVEEIRCITISNNFLQVGFTDNKYPYLIEPLKNLFNGSTLLVEGSNLINYGSSTDFLYTYFTQYSVQNIELALKTGSYDLIRSIDFQSSYRFQQTMHSNYNFVRNNLIRSTGRLFNINYNYDYGVMFSLDGVVKVGDYYYRGFCFVWKVVDLVEFFSATMDGYVMNSVTANQNNTYYYYLDSICPYGFIDGQVLDLQYFVEINDPIALLHSDVISTDEAFPPYTSEPTNTLKMTSSTIFTNLPFTIHKLNLYSYTLTYEGWTYNLNAYPSLNWSTYSYIFKPINHFYFNNGSVIITEPTQNDIENSTNNITGVFALISGAFESLIPLFSIMVLPNISLGVLIFIPLVLTIIIVVIKLVKR